MLPDVPSNMLPDVHLSGNRRQAAETSIMDHLSELLFFTLTIVPFFVFFIIGGVGAGCAAEFCLYLVNSADLWGSVCANQSKMGRILYGL